MKDSRRQNQGMSVCGTVETCRLTTENVCLLGKTGSYRPTSKTAQMTQLRH
jgi:hypothetical protein